MTKKGLTVLGGSNDESQNQDREFLTAEREISTPEFLQAVLENKREDVAKMIVQDDRLVRSRDASGATAVQLAVYHGLDDMLGILLRSEVELDPFEAAAVGDAERVKALIEADPSLLTGHSEDGFPLLGLAAFFGRMDVLELLLEAGADVHLAATNGALVAPIHSATAHRDPDASIAMARRLLEAGADLDAEQAGGFRPLHSAAANGHLELVQLYLQSGADAEAESDLGKTALDLARERGRDDVVAYLESRASR